MLRTRPLGLLLGAAMLAGSASAAASSPQPGSSAAPPAATTEADITTLGRGFEPLAPGEYRIGRVNGGRQDLPGILITLPEGWHNIDGWGVHRGSPDEPTVAIQFWDVGQVYGHPCQWEGTLTDPGPSVDALADALVDIPLRNASQPVDVVLDGRSGSYLEWSVPADIDFTGCDTDGSEHYFESWTGGNDGDRYHQGPGQVDRLWILDIDGARLVIDAFDMPSATDAERQELHNVTASIRFEEQAPDAPAVAAVPRPAIGEVADDGARIVAVDTLDARTRDLTIESPSVGTVQVRLLLPAGFEADGAADWPVLYLLHGYGQGYASWTDLTDVAALTAPTDLLVVMPDADSGWYSDAWNDGEGGSPAWETFHTTELLQLLERNWQAGEDRVVAGLSMGGLGAMDYAARHPGHVQGGRLLQRRPRHLGFRPGRWRSRCSATLSPRLTSGWPTTPSNSHRHSRASHSTCRTATASPARSTLWARCLPTSSSGSPRRTRPSCRASKSWALRSRSTPMGREPTNGRTGSEPCISRCRCCSRRSVSGGDPVLGCR